MWEAAPTGFTSGIYVLLIGGLDAGGLLTGIGITAFPIFAAFLV